MSFIRQNLDKHFVMALKSNRTVALCEEHKKQGIFKCIRTQSNHVFMSIYAAFQLECLKIKHQMNHFALRRRIYLNALQQAIFQLHILKNA